MIPREIKNTLEDKGLTQCTLAVRIGVSKMSVFHVNAGKQISDRVISAIAETIGEDISLVFSECYLQPRSGKQVKSAIYNRLFPSFGLMVSLFRV